MLSRFIAHLLVVILLISRCPVFAQPTPGSADKTSPEISESELLRVASSPDWLRLLHYVSAWGGWKSELDGSAFFFAQNGKYDPLAELRESLRGIQSGQPRGKFKIHPQCAFPERFRFLRATFNLTWPVVECPKLTEYYSNFHGPIGVSVIFSSAYPNNPASMFGHTFLKIESKRKNELIDMGINYAAFTPGSNMLSFMYKGVFGGYHGSWSMDPYFTKVNEYVNSESRDLWEYKLNFNEAETKRLLDHIWELETNSHFEYFFFDENCSYQILRAIEAIKVDWNLSKHRVYVIPGETVKAISETPEAVRAVRFRPSLFHQERLRYRSLNDSDRTKVRQLVAGQTVESPSPEVMDGALLALMYTRARKREKWSDEDQARENRVITLRTQDPRVAVPLENPPYLLRSRPDRGHDAYGISISAGHLDNETSQTGLVSRLKLRAAYHDLMNADDGYSRFSELEFPWVEFQFHDKEMRIQELGLYYSNSLFPMTYLNHKPSWRMKWDFATERGRECQNCLLQSFEVGLGTAVGGDEIRPYILALGKTDVSSRLAKGYRLRPGAEAGFIWNPYAPFKTRLLGRQLWNALPERSQLDTAQEWTHEGIWENSYSLGRNQELRFRSLVNFSDHWHKPAWFEAQLQWTQYFR